VMSFGEGISREDISLRRSGPDLIVDAGKGDMITLSGWYAGKSHQTIERLQFIGTGADAAGRPTVATYDFSSLAEAADTSRNGHAGGLTPLTRWDLTNGLLAAFLSSSNSLALGGEAAFQYAQQGMLTSALLNGGQQAWSSEQFGITAQPFQAGAASQADGARRLVA
jgi:hypothetical protein